MIYLPELHPLISVIGAFLILLVIFFIMRLRELETELEPKLKIIEPIISNAQIGPPLPTDNLNDYIYTNFVHIIIENISGVQITNCSSYLISLTKHIFQADHVGGLLNVPACAVEVRAPISNRIPLVTASDHYRSVTISPKLPAHFDIVFTRSEDSALNFSPAIQVPHIINNMNFFNDTGVYDFEIAATGDNTPTVTATIRIAWNGNWNEFVMMKLKDE